MDIIKIILVLVPLFVIYGIGTEYRKRKWKNARMYRIRADWDEINDDTDTSYIREVERMYRQKRDISVMEVDDITWNDFDLDEIFHSINNTHSTMGELYLYHILRNPEESLEVLEERDRVSRYFAENEDLRINKEYQLSNIGKYNRVSIYKYKEEIQKFPKFNVFPHIIMGGLQLIALILCLFRLNMGILIFLILLLANLTYYYHTKKKLEVHLPVVLQLGSMLNTIRKMDDLSQYKELKPYAEILSKATKLSSIYRRYFRAMGNITLGVVPDIDALYSSFIVTYLHLDIILFPLMNQLIRRNMDLIIQIYETVGFLDSMISISAFRHKMTDLEGNVLCKPIFINEISYEVKDIYHPLIGVGSITNSIETLRSILITGSNATGKSTFLRTVGINAILAQTIYTVFGSSYKAPFFHIFSSMNLKDNVQKNDSYYMAEVKALKRIIDAVHVDRPILCCIDEVLRGTNTTERIAASSKILEKLSESNVLCFVASHDLELTYILENYYDNYHFQEEVGEEGISCDYILYKGRSYTRNAIHILKFIGFSSEIIEDARQRADSYMNHGKWL
ncbi:MAG: hypothetical protein K0S61_1394 [Anaerocolumna sp.]|nr:hypothetical protein [Anaerocolumna sp.]